MKDFTGFELPKEYTSFLYLHTHLGDVGTIEAICKVWNSFNGWQQNSLRINKVDERLGEITLTDKCIDVNQALLVCSYLVSCHVYVKYEKSLLTASLEV